MIINPGFTVFITRVSTWHGIEGLVVPVSCVDYMKFKWTLRKEIPLLSISENASGECTTCTYS